MGPGSQYARSLIGASYAMAPALRKIAHGIRTKTACGPLVLHLQGDPFVRSQRMVLVFVTLLGSLAFSTLFYQRPMEPVCLDAASEQCRTFACPSCYNIYGTNDCDDVATHAPTDICKNYQPADADAAYRGCEVRPLELCRLPNLDDPGEFLYVDAGPDWQDGACRVRSHCRFRKRGTDSLS